MKDISKAIQYNGKEYRIVFNLNVMEEIQEQFGSVEKWGALCEPSKGEPNVKALKFGFAAMLNEGIDISNDGKTVADPPLTLKQVGRMVSGLGLNNAAAALKTTVVKSTKSNVKNELSTRREK